MVSKEPQTRPRSGQIDTSESELPPADPRKGTPVNSDNEDQEDMTES